MIFPRALSFLWYNFRTFHCLSHTLYVLIPRFEIHAISDSKWKHDLVGVVNGPISIKIPLVLRYVCRRCDGSWKVSSLATKFPGILDTIRRWYKYEGRPQDTHGCWTRGGGLSCVPRIITLQGQR